ncbi:hypothetical protein [Pelosinus sp. UFO1]|uniref:hypothetical protein n=1 Tax=Pelosinus sp. UFO1 TaxID=484770 RepID=UPI0004D11542|nr:hypothetical protein [Pelosinus sp. UFO1]AIF53535.1 hypothetical protein UFO1_3992 [Pelosinus sp. UFO1]
MKLLYCRECGDVFNLAFSKKSCTCGKVYGQYEEDGLHATYSGSGIPLGIHNISFSSAIIEQDALNRQMEIPFQGSRFEAWVIPKNCDTFKKLM